VSGTVHPGEQDARYSDPSAQPVGWDAVQRTLVEAGLSWLTTVRADGRPHVTPLITVTEGARVHFCTGPEEQKAKNLAVHPTVALTTGCNALHGGLDVVVEGIAERVTDAGRVQALADAWFAKYGEEWHFGVREDVFVHPGGSGGAHVFAVHPTTIYGFGKAPYSQTRWRFDTV
jgi:general stress protein 26